MSEASLHMAPKTMADGGHLSSCAPAYVDPSKTPWEVTPTVQVVKGRNLVTDHDRNSIPALDACFSMVLA